MPTTKQKLLQGRLREKGVQPKPVTSTGEQLTPTFQRQQTTTKTTPTVSPERTRKEQQLKQSFAGARTTAERLAQQPFVPTGGRIDAQEKAAADIVSQKFGATSFAGRDTLPGEVSGADKLAKQKFMQAGGTRGTGQVGAQRFAQEGGVTPIEQPVTVPVPDATSGATAAALAGAGAGFGQLGQALSRLGQQKGVNISDLVNKEEDLAIKKFAEEEFGVDFDSPYRGAEFLGTARTFKTSIKDPELAEMQKGGFRPQGGFFNRTIAEMQSKIREKFRQSQAGQDFESTRPDRTTRIKNTQEDLISELGNQVTNLGLSLSQGEADKLTSFFNENERRIKEAEDKKLELRESLFNTQKSQLETQKEKQVKDLKEDRDRQRRVFVERTEKRRKQTISQLNSSGRLTTDASGNLSTDAIALLDKINSDTDASITDFDQDLNRAFQSNIEDINLSHNDSLLKAQSGLDDFRLETEQGAIDRLQKFNDLKLEEQIDIRAEEREELRGTAEEQKQTTMQKNFEEAKRGGFTGDFVDFANKFAGRGITNEGQIGKSAQELLSEAPAVYGLNTRLIDSDTDVKRFVGLVRAFTREGQEEGLSTLEIRDNIRNGFLGFTFTDTDNQARGRFLQNILFGIDELDNVDYQRTATLLKRGQFDGAVDKVERLALGSIPEGKGLEGKRYFEIALAQNNRALGLLDDVLKAETTEGKKLIGPMSRRLTTGELWLAEKDSSISADTRKKVTKLRSALKNLFIEWTTRNAGTAKTADELEFLGDALTDDTDQPDIIRAKLEEFKNSGAIQYNTIRDSVGLPALKENQIVSPESKIDLYQNLADTEELAELQTRQTFRPSAPPRIGELSKVERPRNTRNVANDLNNPANLIAGGVGDKFAAGFAPVTGPGGVTRNFLVFNTVEEGNKAMESDLQAKIGGKSNVIKPTDTIDKLADVWVGGNGAGEGYKQKVSEVLGVNINEVSIDKVTPKQLREALQAAEGFTGGSPLKTSAPEIDLSDISLFDSLAELDF